MRKLIYYTTLCVLPTLISCSKFLEKEPDNRAKLTDDKKVAQLLGTAYPLANYMMFTEAMSDNATDKGSGGVDVINEDSYAWKDVEDDAQDSPDYYWVSCYGAIAASNEALATINAAGNTEAYKNERGEALLARAYAHFMLVTLFAKPYDAATASSNPGVPYVTEPETVVIKQYSRGTVASVYEQIEKDLLEGLPLIDDNGYDVPKYHFNRSAANAFAARFYLYKRDYAKVVQYANASVPNFLPNLRPWNTAYQNLGGNELPLEYQRTNQAANLLLVSAPTNYNYNFNYATLRYGLDPALRVQVLRNPVQATGSGTWSFIFGSVGSQANIAVPKLHMRDFAYSSPSSNFGLPYGTIVLFSVEEVLFNKAEANTYLGNYDAAIADLNTYLSTRLTGVTPGNLPANLQLTQAKILNYYSTTDIKAALITLILEYKRAEFVQEGMRWFDVLRYKIPVIHQFRNNTGTIIRTETLGAEDKRRQLKLPDEVKLSGITDLNR